MNDVACLSPSLTLYSVRPEALCILFILQSFPGMVVMVSYVEWINGWVSSNSEFSNSLFTSSLLLQSAKCLDLIIWKIFCDDKKKSRIYNCIYLGNTHTKKTERKNWKLTRNWNDGIVSNNICILFSASVHFVDLPQWPLFSLKFKNKLFKG